VPYAHNALMAFTPILFKIFTLWRLKFKIDNFIENKKRMQQREDISVSGVYFNKADNRIFVF
jgi:hypothetical protein